MGKGARIALYGLSLLVLPLAAATMHRSVVPALHELTVATWNLEWLVTPETAQRSRLNCRAGQPAALPCDVARNLARDSADLARLAAYANSVDADVFAFQEVENPAIARRIFPGYSICIAPGAGLQHVGFAVRRRLAHRCGPPRETLMLDGRQRAGMSLTIAPYNAPPIELLVVHLKSGCAHDDPDTGGEACEILMRQAAALHTWLVSRTSPAARYILLGDFNRGRAGQATDPFWQLLGGHASTTSLFRDAATGLPFRNCYFGAPFRDAIDHILLSPALAQAVPAGGYRRFGYRNRDVMHYRLSDHCPIRISLNPRGGP